MKTTKLGKWLIQEWLNKEVEDGDYNFAVLIDVVMEIDSYNEIIEMKNVEQELADAKRYGLIED